MAETHLVIGYFPLLLGDPRLRRPEEIVDVFDEVEDVSIDACLWGRYESKIVPIFALKKAKEIADHITVWSGGKPDEWFRLAIHKETTALKRFVLILFPNAEKSIERHRIRHGLPKGIQASVVTKPLGFISTGPGMLQKVQLKGQTFLGFVETRNALVGPPGSGHINPDAEDPIFLGPFQITYDDPASALYAKNVFDRNK